MPELPEAETIRRQLAERVTGRRIERVTVNLPAAVSEHDSPEEFVSLVQGRTIADVARRGKAGRLLRGTPEEPQEKHTHVILGLSGDLDVRYVDPRKFGMMVARAGHDLDSTPEFAQYGPDALSGEFTPQYLYQALQGRRA